MKNVEQVSSKHTQAFSLLGEEEPGTSILHSSLIAAVMGKTVQLHREQWPDDKTNKIGVILKQLIQGSMVIFSNGALVKNITVT